MNEENKNKKKVVAVSGGFDPVHPGHIRMFEQARRLGDELVIILNNDNWLLKKKGFVFMPETERKEVLEALRAVDRVILSSHPTNPEDMTVCNDLIALRPDIFANGGDRMQNNTPEGVVCAENGIKMEFGIGAGGKVESSSWLLNRYAEFIRGETKN